MKLSPSGLWDHARTDEGKKQIRYALVSVVFVPLGQILIQLFGYFVFDKNYTVASIASAAVLTLPNFFANKRFVWRDSNRENLRTQVLVFWVAAMLGVTLATLLTFFVEQAVHNAKPGWIEPLAVFGAQLVGFGVIWVGRYVILDRWLFKVTHHGEEPHAAELEELHRELPI
ncbi:MAG: GtrA family protein [Acidimicrobiia bacterium]